MKNLTDVMIMKFLGIVYISSFVITIIIINILAIPICIIRRAIYEIKTPEQRKVIRENEKEFMEETNSSAINKYYPFFKFKELEETEESFTISKCIWRANLRVIEMFIGTIQAIITVIIIIAIIVILITISITIIAIAVKIGINQI